MSLHMNDAHPVRSDGRRGFATEAGQGAQTAEVRRGQAESSTSTPPDAGFPSGLQTKLQAIADEIDGLWQGALDSQDIDLITRTVDASHGVHRALLALRDDPFVIGHPLGAAHDARRLGPVDRARNERPPMGCS